MTIHFILHFNTNPGEQIVLNIEGQAPILLHYRSGGFWEHTLETKEKELVYRYGFHTNMYEKDVEPRWRKVKLVGKEVFLNDHWYSSYALERIYFSSAYQKVIFSGDSTPKTVDFKPKDGKLNVGVYCPFALPEDTVQIVALGEEKSYDLSRSTADPTLWQASLAKKPFYDGYRYQIVRDGKVLDTEYGVRRVHLFGDDKQSCYLTDNCYQPAKGFWKGAGVAIPVFALRTKNSLGVGDFTDLKALIDWSAGCGLSLVQILPINDTTARYTWKDSYPYAGISIYAFHPQYLDVTKLDGLTDFDKKLIETGQTELNKQEAVDYEKVVHLKLNLARKSYKATGAKVVAGKAFTAFLKENEDWVVKYGAFCYFRDLLGTPNFKEWGEFSEFSQDQLDAILKEEEAKEQIYFWIFLQFKLHEQLLEATEYARSKGVVLKGDIPIGIFRNSCEAWTQPHLFHMDQQAGAPPDNYSEDGQNWGFPTYNWDEMAKDGYQWWKSRMQHMARYFDAYRIDHILGFFRIWQTPIEHTEGLRGHFYPALPFSFDDLKGRGIWLDYDRLTEPFMPYWLLQNYFGHDTTYVIERFLEDKYYGYFKFKEEYNTQRKLQDALEEKPGQDLKTILFNGSILERLKRLQGEVIFITEHRDGIVWLHPRHSVMRTSSFADLPNDQKRAVEDLYNDYFYRRHEQFWKEKALQKLPALVEATDMLVCGEDLGMVPDSVPDVMQKLGMLSLEIERVSKDDRYEFTDPLYTPEKSVVSPSCHDMSTIRMWWEEDRGQTERYAHHIHHWHGDVPQEAGSSVVRKVVERELRSPSVWAIFPLQDLMAMHDPITREPKEEEQINVPSNPDNYWHYRMHLNIEELKEDEVFTNLLSVLIDQTGRSRPN